MRPILPGARGPAVEDIQKRLLKLGFDLGPTGVDGVFMGRTRDAVVSFQSRLGLSEDGVVGDETWSALVDETFTFGDRSLYLRLPHFHGRDVRVLQQALGSLGFSCRDDDGIFGPMTERAVREFQRNSGQPADGIVGPDTLTAIQRLHHVWEGKDAVVPDTGRRSGSDPLAALVGLSITVSGDGDTAADVAARLVNLVHATAAEADVALAIDARPGRAVDVHVLLVESGGHVMEQIPVAILGSDGTEAFGTRLMTALAARSPGESTIAIETPEGDGGPNGPQRTAVRLLDGICFALA